MASALIQLADLKAWLNPNPRSVLPSDDDALLLRLCVSVSQFAVQYLSIPVAPSTFSEVYDGSGTPWITLRRQPVIKVSSLTVGTTSITARSSPTSFGYVADGTAVGLTCGEFCRGVQNVAVTYDAGYQASDAVTAAATVGLAALSHPWNMDRGVAYANGAALTLVTTSPTTGQYQITADTSGRPQYVFAAGDVGQTVVITYGYTPEDVQQALIELAGERYKARLRIGLQSESPGPQQSTSFARGDMNESIRTLLAPYRQVVPIP